MSRLREKGFTLIEVGIIVPILSLFLLTLFSILFQNVLTARIEQARVNMTFDRQNALATMESDVLLSSSYLTTTDAGISDPYPTGYATSGTWSYKGSSSTSRVLLLRKISTTSNPFLDDVTQRLPVMLGDPVSVACNAANLYFNGVQTHNVIYFVYNQNLYRRTVVQTGQQTCNAAGQYQKKSCPSVVDLGGSRSGQCQADDELILQGVTSFSVDYYDAKDSSSPSNVYAGGANPSLVTDAIDVGIRLTITRTASGKQVSTSSNLRLTRINGVLQ